MKRTINEKRRRRKNTKLLMPIIAEKANKLCQKVALTLDKNHLLMICFSICKKTRRVKSQILYFKMKQRTMCSNIRMKAILQRNLIQIPIPSKLKEDPDPMKKLNNNNPILKLLNKSNIEKKFKP